MPEDGCVEFTLNGRRLAVTAEQVRQCVDAFPEPVRQHGVRIDGVVYPVKQAFELATGVPRAEFTSHIARRHLAALGFELVGEIETRDPAKRPPVRSQPEPGSSPGTAVAAEQEWHSEKLVQAAVVRFLTADGWQIVSVADTDAREHGIDVVAQRRGQRLAIEVKGFPSRNYANPARAAETKRTQPSTQAKHWYAQAVLAAMLTRSRRPDHASVIALPDFPRYRDLHRETASSLRAAYIGVWWVGHDGTVDTHAGATG